MGLTYTDVVSADARVSSGSGFGNLVTTIATVELDSAYPDNGEALTASSLNMTRILHCIPSGAQEAEEGFTVVFNKPLGTLQVFGTDSSTAADTKVGHLEADSLTSADLAGVKCSIVVWGVKE